VEWQLGFLTIRAYGVMIALGLLAGTLLAAAEARRRGLFPRLGGEGGPGWGKEGADRCLGSLGPLGAD